MPALAVPVYGHYQISPPPPFYMGTREQGSKRKIKGQNIIKKQRPPLFGSGHPWDCSIPPPWNPRKAKWISQGASTKNSTCFYVFVEPSIAYIFFLSLTLALTQMALFLRWLIPHGLAVTWRAASQLGPSHGTNDSWEIKRDSRLLSEWWKMRDEVYLFQGFGQLGIDRLGLAMQSHY